MKSPYVNELEPDRVITTSFLVQSKEIRQKKTGEPYLSLLLGDRTGELDAKMWDNVAEVMETLRPRRLRAGQGADSDFPQSAAVDHPQDAADGRHRSRFRRFLPCLVAAAGRDVGGATVHRRADERRPSEGPAGRLAGRPGDCPPLSGGAGRQADSSCVAGGPDRARSVAMRAGEDGAAAHYPIIDLRPAADRRGAARYRQDLRAQLRARFQLHQRGPATGPHYDRAAHGG